MIMVGDRLCTDQKRVENAGIDVMPVLGGEAQREDLPGPNIQLSWVEDHLGAF